MVKQYHPDKLQDNPLRHLAEEKLKAINAAYEVLGNPEKRAKYDAQRLKNTGYSDGNVQPTRPTHSAPICYKHNDRHAVSTCQFCGRDLCQECASLFTIVSCPECLSANNASYLKTVQKAVIKPLIIYAAVVLIGLLAGSGIVQPAAAGLYILGLYWGWESIHESATTALLGGLIFGPYFSIGSLVALFIFGWVIGLFVGGYHYIKLLLHYQKTRKIVLEAEKYSELTPPFAPLRKGLP